MENPVPHRAFSVRNIVIALMLLGSRFPAMAGGDPAAELRMRQSAAGKMLDKLYYDAGTRVDIAGFDLKELVRQGRKGWIPCWHKLQPIAAICVNDGLPSTNAVPPSSAIFARPR